MTSGRRDLRGEDGFTFHADAPRSHSLQKWRSVASWIPSVSENVELNEKSHLRACFTVTELLFTLIKSAEVVPLKQPLNWFLKIWKD